MRFFVSIVIILIAAPIFFLIGETQKLRQENITLENRWIEQENIIHTFQLTGLTGEETVACCIKSLSCDK